MWCLSGDLLGICHVLVAIVICIFQALVRGMFARRLANRIRVKLRTDWVIIKFQSLMRKCLAIAYVQRLRAYIKLTNDSATTIQCMYRCWKARKVILELRTGVHYELCVKSAITIQRRWRGVLGRQRARKVRQERQALLEKKKRSALHIQRVYRGEYKLLH